MQMPLPKCNQDYHTYLFSYVKYLLINLQRIVSLDIHYDKDSYKALCLFQIINCVNCNRPFKSGLLQQIISKATCVVLYYLVYLCFIATKGHVMLILQVNINQIVCVSLICPEGQNLRNILMCTQKEYETRYRLPYCFSKLLFCLVLLKFHLKGIAIQK